MKGDSLAAPPPEVHLRANNDAPSMRLRRMSRAAESRVHPASFRSPEFQLRVAKAENVTTKVSRPLFATKTRRKAKARRIFHYFSFVSSKNFEPSWLLAV